MSQLSDVRELITELLNDEKTHTAQEIINLAIEKSIIDQENVTAVRNAVYRMNKEKEIVTVEKGVYKKRNIPSDFVSAEKFEESIDNIEKKMNELLKFDWVNCSNEELDIAREQANVLKKFAIKLSNTFLEKRL